MKKIKKYNMLKKPFSIYGFLKPIVKMIAFPTMKKRNLTVNKVNMEGIETPYLILSNHHSFFDFEVMARVMYPEFPNYVAAIDGFYDYTEWLMRHVGCICKRKFTNDLNLIKQMKYSIDKLKNSVVIYPEARYSIDGTNAVLPASLGKLVKLLKVPVVVFNMKGNYIAQPQWNKVTREIPFKVDMTQIVTKKELAELSIEEINKRINEAFIYNDWEYQKSNNYINDAPDRADHLNRVLYQCPHCLKEHQMEAHGTIIECMACHKTWELTNLGEIKATTGETEYDSVPKWFAFERDMVRKQVEDGTYCIDQEGFLETLPNAQKFYRQGKAHFRHSLDGFMIEGTLYGEPFQQKWNPLENYSCHIEYNFKKKADAVDLSTTNESYWMFFPNAKDIITKISLATEEIYKIKILELNKNNKNIVK